MSIIFIKNQDHIKLHKGISDSESLGSINSDIEFVPKDASIEHFPADVYFENGWMTFIFDNAMLSMEVDNTKLEELKALIKQERGE